MPPRNDPNPVNNSGLSLGGWLGIKPSVSGALNLVPGVVKGLYAAANDIAGTSVAVAKSVYGTATRVDDYARLIQNSHGVSNTPARQRARDAIRGKGLEDIGNAALVTGAVAAADVALGKTSIGQQINFTQKIKGLSKEYQNQLNAGVEYPEIISTATARDLSRVHLNESRTEGNRWVWDNRELRGTGQSEHFMRRSDKAPGVGKHKLQEAKSPTRGIMADSYDGRSMYERMKENPQGLPPIEITYGEGRAYVANGHHRQASVQELLRLNQIDPLTEIPIKYRRPWLAKEGSGYEQGFTNASNRPIWKKELTPLDRIQQRRIQTAETKAWEEAKLTDPDYYNRTMMPQRQPTRTQLNLIRAEELKQKIADRFKKNDLYR